jgi:hypothetical protein
VAGGAADRWFHIYTHAMKYVNDMTYILHLFSILLVPGMLVMMLLLMMIMMLKKAIPIEQG